MATLTCNQKAKRGLWSTEQLSQALRAYNTGQMGLNECARVFDIPKATLKRHLDGRNLFANGEVKKLGRLHVLPEYVENELVNHILLLENMFFGVTRKELMKLAFQVAEINDIPNIFNRELQSAGKVWYRGFMQRHRDKLVLRRPEATSIARASGFNKIAVGHYFDLLEDLIDSNNLTPMQIFNMDETGISVVQKRCQKVIGRKGKHQIGAVSSGERGVNTTVVCCSNAAGLYVPPLILFKRKRMADALKNGAPPGSIVTCNETGWMDSITFVNWLHHFIDFVKPSEEKKVLLVLDGHNSHVKNLDAILLARKSHVIMLSLPPHTTHKAQPLDKTLFKPLQMYYDEAVERWLRGNVGNAVTPYQVCSLFTEAYCKAATMTAAIKGFACCGIWPCSRDVFRESEFQPSFSGIPLMSTSAGMSTPQKSSSSDAPRQLVDVTPKAPSQLDASTEASPKLAQATPEAPPQLIQATEAAPQRVEETRRAPPQGVGGTQRAPRKRVGGTREAPPQQVGVTRRALFQRVEGTLGALPQRVEGTRGAPSQRVEGTQGALPQSTQHTPLVYSTKPDGRCFFRSIVIALEPKLQVIRDNGILTDQKLMLEETSKADALRNRMVLHCLQQYEDLSATMTGDFLNADMPPNVKFANLLDRLTAMGDPHSMVGELEICKTAELLKRTIKVSVKDVGSLLTYGEEFVDSNPISILYTPLAEDVGHYDTLRVSDPSAFAKAHISSILGLEVPTLPPKRANNKLKRRAEVLTSSPYKEGLERSQNVKISKKSVNPKVHVNEPLEKRKQKSKSKKSFPIRRASNSDNASLAETSWYCFLCAESLQEEMICCRGCERWVHVECAGTDDILFVCEVCSEV